MEGDVLDVGEGITRGVHYFYVLTVTGANKWTYEWRVEDFSHSQAPYLETEDFFGGGHKWKLKLIPKATHLEVDYIAINLVSLNPTDMSVNLMVEAVNHRNAQYSRVSCAKFVFKPNEEHGFPRFQGRCSVIVPNSEFFQQGRYVVKTCIEVVPTETPRRAPVRRETVPQRAPTTVHVAILTDELFTKKLNKMHPFGLVYLPDATRSTLPASTELSCITAITAEACSDRGLNEAAWRLWICDSASDGSARVQCPLRSWTSSSARTVGDLCTEREHADIAQLTLYVEASKDGFRLSELCDDSWILFCKCMHPSQQKLVYLGSITLPKTCTVRDLEAKARRLRQWARDVEFEIVVQKDDICPARVWKSVTLENSGLQNGGVFLLCQTPPNSTINMQRLHERLESLFCQTLEALTLSSEQETSRQQHGSDDHERTTRDRLDELLVRQLETVVGGQSNDRLPAQDQEELCAICLDKPRTSGFLHADSEVHICACIECASAVMEAENPRCPLCNQAVIHMIKKVR